MKLEFTKDDFKAWVDRAAIACRANHRLAEMLSSATVVTAIKTEDIWLWSKNQVSSDTHKALLINIEEIVKVPCKHSPKFTASHRGMLMNNTCEKCGVELVATWAAK